VSAALERCHNIKFTSSILTSHNKLQCTVCGTILNRKLQSRTVAYKTYVRNIVHISALIIHHANSILTQNGSRSRKQYDEYYTCLYCVYVLSSYLNLPAFKSQPSFTARMAIPYFL